MNDIIKQLNNTIYFEKVANKPLGNQNDLITKLSAAFNYSQDNAKQFINALNYYAFYVHDIDNAQNISFDYKAIDSNPDLHNTFNFCGTVVPGNYCDWISDTYQRLFIHHDFIVYFRCTRFENGSASSVDIPLMQASYSIIFSLLCSVEHHEKDSSLQSSGNTALFWNEQTFANLTNVFLDIYRNKLNAIPPFIDYKYCEIITNGIQQIYKITDKKAVPLLNGSPLVRQMARSSDYGLCLSINVISSFKDKDDSLSDSIIKHLFYFTTGDKNTFDNLCKDYVYIIMNPFSKTKNTIISGNLDKLPKWLDFINYSKTCVNSNYRNTFIYNWTQNSEVQSNALHNQHLYFLTPRYNSEFDTRSKFLHIEFSYDGKFYDLPLITNQETVQICELFYAHGWHLLNGSAISRKAKTRNIEDEFIKSLDKTDEKTGIRIPAALIYQLYTYYAKREKQTKPISDSALYKLIQESGFRYETMKNRKSDVEYIAAELKPIMEKFCPGFDEKWLEENKTNKSITCTINNDFWKALTAPSAEEACTYNEELFGKYIKELWSRYSWMFKPEPILPSESNSDENKKGNETYVLGSRYFN